MSNEEKETKIKDPDHVTIKDVVTKMVSGYRYIKSKWAFILGAAIFGGIAGLACSIFQKPTYTAVCSFVLEETNKTSGLGQYSGLASLAGINLGGSDGGIFQGDNILELYKSRLMIEKALLSEATFNGRNELLIDRYIDYHKLRAEWKEKDKIDSISFAGNPANFNRKQDSILTDLVEQFNRKHLNVTKPDKKLSIINVYFNSRDELFAKEFTNKLVQTVNDFYTLTKTKKTSQNILVLQKQADSVKRELNSSIAGVASAIDAAPNANPLTLSLRVPSQRKQVDVQASSAIYAEIVKNLELSKISLRQETPLIQVIDQPVLPLYVSHISKLKGILGGIILGAIISIMIIGVRKFFIYQLQ
ncbi:MAG TPA: hypothetical protein VJ844_03105 [Mucilaginibacter sp.]|nr:hypothetical protein [Mucilaginibacter sp.]